MQKEVCLILTLNSEAEAVIVPHRMTWSWYTGRWWVSCYIWYSKIAFLFLSMAEVLRWSHQTNLQWWELVGLLSHVYLELSLHLLTWVTSDWLTTFTIVLLVELWNLLNESKQRTSDHTLQEILVLYLLSKPPTVCMTCRCTHTLRLLQVHSHACFFSL